MINYSKIRRKVRVCLYGIVFLLCACKSYQFRENGFIVDGDGVYHNVHNTARYTGIALFGDFVNYDKSEQQGTRFDKLYPEDKKVLKSLGYHQGDVEVLFSGIPNQAPYYHLIGIGAKNGLLDTKASILQSTPTGKYHYRKEEVGNNMVMEAIISSGESNYALIYYVPKGGHTADFELLLERNVRFPDQPLQLYTSKTEVDCALDRQKNVEIQIPQTYVNRDVYTLTKVMRKESYGESLAVYTLNKKEADPQVVFKLCPGDYRVIYSDLSHRELWSKAIEVR